MKNNQSQDRALGRRMAREVAPDVPESHPAGRDGFTPRANETQGEAGNRVVREVFRIRDTNQQGGG